MSNNQDELQKAIDDITKADVENKQEQAPEKKGVDLIAEIAAKFAGQTKPMPEVKKDEAVGVVEDSSVEQLNSVDMDTTGVEVVPEIEMPAPQMPDFSSLNNFGTGNNMQETNNIVQSDFGGKNVLGDNSIVGQFGEEITNNTQDFNSEAISVEKKEVGLVETDDELRKVKEDALRDLAPLVEKLEKTDWEKFNLYVEIVEKLKDKTVVARMHEAARKLINEEEKAKALLKVVEVLDNL